MTDEQTMLLNDKYKLIYDYALYLTKNIPSAKDLSQDAYLKIMQAFQKGIYKEEGYFLAYAKRVTYNIFQDKNRSHNNSKTTYCENMTWYKVADEEKETLTRAEVLSLLNSMRSQEIKDVFILRIFYNMKYKDISEKMNTSIMTAIGRMRYAMKKVKAN